MCAHVCVCACVRVCVCERPYESQREFVVDEMVSVAHARFNSAEKVRIQRQGLQHSIAVPPKCRF